MTDSSYKMMLRSLQLRSYRGAEITYHPPPPLLLLLKPLHPGQPVGWIWDESRSPIFRVGTSSTNTSFFAPNSTIAVCLASLCIGHMNLGLDNNIIFFFHLFLGRWSNASAICTPTVTNVKGLWGLTWIQLVETEKWCCSYSETEERMFIACGIVFISVAQSCPTLWPQRLQHSRLPCQSPTLGACSNSCPSSQWCHPTISSSVVPFSSCLQSFPASGSFPISYFFASGGQSIGVSASASVLPMNTQDWSPLGWTGWIFLQSKGFSRVFFSIHPWSYLIFTPSITSNYLGGIFRMHHIPGYRN